MNELFFNTPATLPIITGESSRAINAENPKGEKGGGGRASSILGAGRKGRPCITLKSGKTEVIAEIEGCGIINHIWITVTDKTSDANRFVLRDIVLRMYWDGENEPSVECPLGDFFCLGFGESYTVCSSLISVNPLRGMNCYIPMPFKKGAVITVENQHPCDIDGFFFQIDYCLRDSLPDNTGYLHAQWRRESLTEIKKDYTIVDGIVGEGQYIGTFLCLQTLSRYWWGEGEIKAYIDGDNDYPTICGTGTEDYFGGAWSFASHVNGECVETNFCSPYLGFPFYKDKDTAVSNPFHNRDLPPMRSFYRWHVADPIRFRENFKITVQQIGICHGGLFERQDDVSSVGYWYQTEPHAPFPAFLLADARHPR
ncbi:MAG: DUF2961 domain-containing protein [Clostridia bacterium]|nr:DUF2961 domain-containing protein [Clostridia bacterium]